MIFICRGGGSGGGVYESGQLICIGKLPELQMIELIVAKDKRGEKKAN
jgi:hypothetical protein